MSRAPIQRPGTEIRAMSRAILDAGDTQIVRIVATVDAMTQRGSADLLIEPLRQRLAAMRLPRPLRMGRLMFYPLDLVIVAAGSWRRGQQAIPRTALMPMAQHVSLEMGAPALAIKAEIAGHTTADVELISRLGRSLWPAASAILGDLVIPATWKSTELGDANYRPLASAVAALLADAAILDTACAEAATGWLPPTPALIEAILCRVARVNKPALPMMIAVLLDRLPEAADLLPPATSGPEAAAVQAAVEAADELLLSLLDEEDRIETRIGFGTLAEAGGAVKRVVGLLKHLDSAASKPHRREQVRAVRRRLDAVCEARFTSGLKDELLGPLQQSGVAAGAAEIAALEAAARGLRILETEARVAGGGSNYDALLDQAVAAVKDKTVPNRLSRGDRIRLVEILRGPDAALAMLGQG